MLYPQHFEEVRDIFYYFLSVSSNLGYLVNTNTPIIPDAIG
jgi:hypothetical protein